MLLPFILACCIVAEAAVCPLITRTDTSGSVDSVPGTSISCSWLIQPQQASNVAIIFDVLTLYSNCLILRFLRSFSGFVAIYDGPDTQSPLLANLSTESNLPSEIYSSGNSLLVTQTTGTTGGSNKYFLSL